ncbi:MAG: YvcK family protein [Anaeromyxobacteraceae bacterium]
MSPEVEVVSQERRPEPPPRPALAAPLRVVAFGGGTGLPRVLAGLLRLRPAGGGPTPGVGEEELTGGPPLAITAVVAASDDGGSSGALRRAFGVPAPGDARNCLVALAGPGSPLAGVFQHRFEGEAGLAGHPVGNLVLTALAQRLGDFGAAVDAAAALLGARGRVVPATHAPAALVGELADGTEVAGESALAGAGIPVSRVRLARAAAAPAAVLEALAEADLVVLGPGSLYSSVLASALADGVARALAETPATRVLVVNLACERGEAAGLSPAGHVRAVLRHLGDAVDVALLDRSTVGPAERAAVEALGVVPVTAELLPDAADPAQAGLHDPAKLARALLRLARVR